MTTLDYVILGIMLVSVLSPVVISSIIEEIKQARCQHNWEYPHWQKYGWNRIPRCFYRRCTKCGKMIKR